MSYASAYHNVLATPSVQPQHSPVGAELRLGRRAGSTSASPTTPTPTPGPNVFDAPNLSGLLQDAGIPWKSYQEDTDLVPTSGTVNFPAPSSLTSTVAPQSQWTVPIKSLSGTSAAYTNPYYGAHQYNFAVKHDGQLFFSKTNGGTLTAPDNSPSNPETPHYAAAATAADRPRERHASPATTWITPNQFNDMHSSLNTDFTYNGVTYAHNTDAEAIAIGDNFLSQIVPQIMASQAYKNNGAIVIWNDETEGTNANDFSHTSTEIVISPLAKGNAYNSTLNYTHSSDLKTMQEVFGVHAPGGGFLGDANTPGTNDLRDLFKPGVISPGVLLTDPHGDDALSVSGHSTVTAPNGGAVVVNSDSDHAASVEGGST